MNAQEFNTLYDEKVINKLVNEYGFIKRGQNAFLQSDCTYFSLIRTSFRSLPVAYVFLCLRHSFLRDLNDNVGNLFEKNPNSYPFKVSPFEISYESLKYWHYEPRYYGMGYEGEVINYGADDNLFGSISYIPNKLDGLYKQVVTVGFKWRDILTPFEALKQLRKYNHGARTELDWLDDYKNHSLL